MNLTVRMLSVFSSVARNLSFTKAANELHLSQPAVSMQVKQLEEAIGLPLFEHLGKKVYLTEAGKEVFHYAQSIAQQFIELEHVIEGLRGGVRGSLSVAVASTANYFATRLLAEFSQRQGQLTYRLEVTNRQTLLVELQNNDKDLVIMGRPPDDADLVAEPFMENPLVVIAPPMHALAREHKIPLSRLAQERFVLRESGSGTRIAMERFFEERGVRVTTSMEFTSNEALKQAVQAGLGLGIVSVHTIELELEARRLVVLDVEQFPIMRHWYVVTRKGKRLSPIALAFKEFVLTQTPSVLR